MEGLLVTPVAPHSAFNRALFLSQHEKLALRILPTSGHLGVEVDGQLVAHPQPGKLIDITVDAAAARVVPLLAGSRRVRSPATALPRWQ
ncbi:hypothetical protein MOQ72_36410 [Saccharopolyspora sp. K220]|uniref:hypothetical protein n=1 Tax=Saccharopolyspora soli TaxID=2926618 RepID=UPI001F5698B2|nr:hypothetical protein [Saccharopolyspora soli]MCI2422920.1 hypothetical protein [Saccharopolyspora soli]